ncbi:MAG: transposase [Candidatus Pacebacteria bacterium]|nr:transposase [Candidatus Paceibacterota bacterium]
MTREKPANDEYYHIYNRGTDKRSIFTEKVDQTRFLKSIIAFNTIKPVGSLYHADRLRDTLFDRASKSEKLVEVIAYCLNMNHYHLILRQVAENGISEFMKRLGGGYTYYFNEKYDRSGVLFQGKYKHKHIHNDTYLKHLSVYVNLNYEVHKYSGPTSTSFYSSSWDEYVDSGKVRYKMCTTNIILSDFSSIEDYKVFASEALNIILKNKEIKEEVEFNKPKKEIVFKKIKT